MENAGSARRLKSGKYVRMPTPDCPTEQHNTNPAAGRHVTPPLVPLQSPYVARGERRHWAARASLGLGITQIILGVIVILAQIILLAKDSEIAVTSTGFICGILFIVTGGFGIGAAKRGTSCLIITVMVLTILSAASTALIVSFSSIGMIVDSYRPDRWLEAEECEYRTTPPTTLPSTNTSTTNTTTWSWVCQGPTWRYYHNHGLINLLLSMHGIILVAAVLEVIIAAVASALTCRTICCYTERERYIVAYTVTQPEAGRNQPVNSPLPELYPSGDLFAAASPPSYASCNADVPTSDKVRETMVENV